MSLFFNPSLNIETKNFIFSAEESKHICKVLRKVPETHLYLKDVLRKVPGDKVIVTNGKGLEWLGELIQVGQRYTQIKKIKANVRKGIPYELEIAIAPTKSNDRIEWFIEKATEIGVKKIHFIKSENSERRRINLTRFQKIAISAMKQSKQFYLPEIEDIISYKKFLKKNTIEKKYIAYCDDSSKKHITDIYIDFKPLIILIGPEGDFNKNEISIALSKGYQPISLGDQRFRTETAALYATLTVSTLFYIQKNKL